MRFDVRRRARRLRMLAAAAMATAVMLVCAGPALAGTDTYCSSCVVPDNTVIGDGSAFYLVTSYFHYLGTGDRWIGAAAINYGSWVYGNNEVAHLYGGGNLLQAEAHNASGHPITANAHASY